jgi:hypothetical protein
MARRVDQDSSTIGQRCRRRASPTRFLAFLPSGFRVCPVSGFPAFGVSRLPGFGPWRFDEASRSAPQATGAASSRWQTAAPRPELPDPGTPFSRFHDCMVSGLTVSPFSSFRSSCVRAFLLSGFQAFGPSEVRRSKPICASGDWGSEFALADCRAATRNFRIPEPRFPGFMIA